MSACQVCSAKLIPGSLFCDTCGAPSPGVQSARKLRQGSQTTVKEASKGLLKAGETLKGRGTTYLIEEHIAKSGFGATFRATRLQDDKQVVVKQMLDQASYDQFKKQLFRSFKREAQFLKRVNHPAFPRGYESFERFGSFYLIMDFINGRDLSSILEDIRQKEGKVSENWIVTMGIQIADALEVIHVQGYLYRDLKPQNVMLDAITSKLKLIDFGTLYHPSDYRPLIFESEGFTPPDLLKTNATFTPAGDIYSLGALMFDAATGTTPKVGEFSALDSVQIDPRLKEIILKCLQPEPSKRYQRATQVSDELQRLTRRGFLPFTNTKRIEPAKLTAVPKTIYPSKCTFCDKCGHSDPSSQTGYCPNCNIPLKVGRLVAQVDTSGKSKEFLLYADETTVGSSSQANFELAGEGLGAKHFRIFRKQTSLWVEVLDEKKGETSLLNQRRFVGPIELNDGDVIRVGNTEIRFHVKDAC